MIRGIRDFLRGGAQASLPGQRRKLFFDRAPDHIYAVGAVHGYDGRLGRLEDLTVADTSGRDGTTGLCMLGDCVARGAKSSEVLSRLTTRPLVGIRRIWVAGTHDALLFGFVGNASPDAEWLGL